MVYIVHPSSKDSHTNASLVGSRTTLQHLQVRRKRKIEKENSTFEEARRIYILLMQDCYAVYDDRKRDAVSCVL